MKKLFLLLFSLLPLVLPAQQRDSISLAREVDSLIQKNRDRVDQNDFEEALRVIEYATTVAKKSFGEKSSWYAKCLHNHGRTFYYMDQFADAEPLYLLSDSIWALVGRENADCAQNLFNLGVLYYFAGYYAEARPFFQESGEIRKRVLGKNSAQYADVMIFLGNLEQDTGNTDIAETCFLECAEARKIVYGEESRWYADCLNNLALLYEQLGRYEEAEQLHLKAMAIRQKFGEETPDYTQSLDNLGGLYLTMGRYLDSERTHLRTREILEKLHGPDDPSLANCLINLGIVCHRMGRNEEAERYFITGKALYEKDNSDQFKYSLILNNLGVLYWATGRYQEAEPLFLEAMSIRGDLGKRTKEYLESVNNLGNLYWATKEYEKAESLYQEALAIRGEALGKDHPDYAQSLNNLGVLYMDMGRFEEIEQLFEEAIGIIDQKLGKEHLNYTDVTDNFAIFRCLMGQYGEAKSLFLEINQIRREMISRHSRYLPEQELSSFISLFERNLDEFYSFSQNRNQTMAELPAVCYDNVLFHKGFLLETISKRRNLVLADSNAIRLDNQKRLFLRRLAFESLKQKAERDTVKLFEWQEAANNVERELIQIFPDYGGLLEVTTWKEVQKKLKPGSAAVEFIHYNFHDPQPTDSVFYSALVLFPGDSPPQFVTLFEEKELLGLLDRPDLSDEVLVRELYGSKPGLNRLFWAPLEPLLRGVTTIYYSPAGLLHFIDPAAMTDESGNSLSQGRQWVRLYSTRDLVTSQLADGSFAKGAGHPKADSENQPAAVLYGGIMYDMDSLAFVAANPVIQGDPATEQIAVGGNFRNLSSGAGSRGELIKSWKFLPGTEREVAGINAILQKAGFKTAVYKGLYASEERLKMIGRKESSPRILVLATHGFSYPDPEKNPVPGNDVSIFKVQDDPMLRSGVILAGANFFYENKRTLGNQEDGVLVAYEARDLHLRNTELAVLSACQTGLGGLAGSEGIFGLQRAFRIAGTSFLILTLWNVPDDQTEEFMLLFFRNWAEEGKSMRDAFDGARQSMRKKYKDPYKWAGFILVE